MQRPAILFASALVALALCAAEESYSGLDDDLSPPVGSTAPGGSLSYAEALRRAQKGEADQAVLGAFRKQYADAKEGGADDTTLGPLRVNLAAVLLDVANKIGEPDVWLPMYKEAQMLSHEALAIDPQDDAAQANLKAATNSISFRQSAAIGGVAAPKPAGGSADVDMESARALLLDDDDDEDEDDQDGGIDEPDVKPAGGGVLTYAQAMVMAQEGKADNDVLQAFRDGLASAEAAGNANDIASKKTNLAAIFIDLAKTENDPAEWEPMYEECIKMCDDVLQVDPENESAKANKMAAGGWLEHRRKVQATMDAEALERNFLDAMSSTMDAEALERAKAAARVPVNDGLSEEERAKRFLLEDDEDEEDEL